MAVHATFSPEIAPLLRVHDLRIVAGAGRNGVTLVDGIGFDVRAGEFVGIVGESGCGKSMTALSVLGLLPRPHVLVAAGSILFEGRDLISLGRSALRRIRGKDVAMVFQDPMSSLNPVQTIGDQIAEAILLHEPVGRVAARRRATELLDEVNIPAAAQRLLDYPYQLSGGMRQRVMIAMAIACRPKLLIADEPTTALDVTIQAQILALLDRLRTERRMATVLITHDLGVIAEHAERVLVMYGGRIVEEAPVTPLFEAPLHPYTRGLLSSIPPIDGELDELPAIEGMPPEPGRGLRGCPFHPRCAYGMPACEGNVPALLAATPDRRVACLLHGAPEASRHD